MNYKILNTITGKLKEKYFLVAVLLAVTVFGILFWSLAGSKPARSEKYEDVSGAAGLSALINYDCTEPCAQKFDFNVYFFTDDGRQVSVVRPNKEGSVDMALAEGRYTMLIGKKFNNVFPQESLELKNGKVLELKLRY